MKNKERGITLIALVVTIIILLILAGVAINMALGDNGLFQKSKQAVNTWRDAESNEQSILGEIDSFLDENMNPNKVKVEYKKTPIKSGDNTVAVGIDFTVVGLTKEVGLALGEELMNDIKKLVQGKSEEQKEEILNNIIIANKEQIDFEPKTLEGLYSKHGLEGEHRNLTELATSEGINQEEADSDGVELDEELIIRYIFRLGGAPYYREDYDNGKFYKLLDEYELGELKPIEYEITTTNSNITNVDSVLLANENGTYNFKIKILVTGEEISIQVPVTEIDNSLEVIAGDYLVVNYQMTNYALLANQEEGKLEIFDTAYFIFGGKIYNVSDAISNKTRREDYRIEDFVNSKFPSTGDNEFSTINGLYALDSALGISLGYGQANIIIIKNNKLYFGLIGNDPV